MSEHSAQIAVIGSSGEGKSAALKYFYDATVAQRFEYVVEENGEEFETAHVYSPKFNDDEIYLDWTKGWDIRTNSKGEADETYEKATVNFWDKVIEKVENFDGGEDWKTKIPAEEKLEGISNLLAVAVATNQATGKVRTGAISETQTIITESYFNGIKPENVVKQKHVLTNLNRDEWKKKYNRIQSKRFKQEKVGGLRREPKILYIPQNEAIGGLYDEMMIETDGFVDKNIPLRFKTTVIHHIFDSKLDEKK